MTNLLDSPLLDLLFLLLLLVGAQSLLALSLLSHGSRPTAFTVSASCLALVLLLQQVFLLAGG